VQVALLKDNKYNWNLFPGQQMAGCAISNFQTLSLTSLVSSTCGVNITCLLDVTGGTSVTVYPNNATGPTCDGVVGCRCTNFLRKACSVCEVHVCFVFGRGCRGPGGNPDDLAGLCTKPQRFLMASRRPNHCTSTCRCSWAT
jgi:hypothetical protein